MYVILSSSLKEWRKKISVTHGINVLGYTAIQIGSLGEDQNQPVGYSDDVTSCSFFICIFFIFTEKWKISDSIIIENCCCRLHWGLKLQLLLISQIFTWKDKRRKVQLNHRKIRITPQKKKNRFSLIIWIHIYRVDPRI